MRLAISHASQWWCRAAWIRVAWALRRVRAVTSARLLQWPMPLCSRAISASHRCRSAAVREAHSGFAIFASALASARVTGASAGGGGTSAGAASPGGPGCSGAPEAVAEGA
eukprot:12263618-Alexandrium_andersonii.AAC.1